MVGERWVIAYPFSRRVEAGDEDIVASMNVDVDVVVDVVDVDGCGCGWEWSVEKEKEEDLIWIC